MSGPVDVRGILERAGAWPAAPAGTQPWALAQVDAAVAELVEADREQDAARSALIDLNRRIATTGWIDVEFDALRKAGDRFVKAQMRRDRALDNIGIAS